MRNDELSHHGILGQKWGIRRFRDKWGALTTEGRKRYTNYYEEGQKAAANTVFLKNRVEKVLERKSEKEEKKGQTRDFKEFIKAQAYQKLKDFVGDEKGQETIQKGSDALTKISSSIIKKGYQADPYIRKGAKKAYEMTKKGAKVVAKGSAKAIKTYAPAALNAALSASKYASEYAAKSAVLLNDAAKKSARLLKVASNTGSKALHTILKMRKAG